MYCSGMFLYEMALSVEVSEGDLIQHFVHGFYGSSALCTFFLINKLSL